MKKRIDKSEILTLEKIKRDFNLMDSFYFSEVSYDDDDGKFFDLYLWLNKSGISDNQVEIYNRLIKNLEKYSIEINNFIESTYSNFERKKLEELNSKKLDIDVISIPDDNENFEAVLVCGKQYKLFGLFKRDIGIRIEFKNGMINSMERKSDTTKENVKKNVY
ncbi:MAG: hypothetical protein HRT69_14285 [Flavobacteriaceae bacterium]|nr:hypothetical protein [Flavobacteriaceae bacterium]